MDIKEKVRNCGFNQWEVAEALNVSEWTLSRWLRRPEKLSEEIVNTINNAIISLKEISTDKNNKLLN